MPTQLSIPVRVILEKFVVGGFNESFETVVAHKKSSSPLNFCRDLLLMELIVVVPQPTSNSSVVAFHRPFIIFRLRVIGRSRVSEEINSENRNVLRPQKVKLHN